VPFILLILSLSPDTRRRPRVPIWPIRLVKILLAFAYFGAGYTKVEAGGLLWADGVTLQGYLLMKYLEADAQMGFLVAQSYWACLTLSVLTIAWELTFPVILWLDNRHPVTRLYVTAGILFHLTIAATMKIAHFLPFMGLTYCAGSPHRIGH
jgi:hypothetical protein